MANAFKIVKDVGLTLPDVEATTKYDGSPVLKLDGVFVAGLASHSSAEPDSLVVRVGLEERELEIKQVRELHGDASADESPRHGAALLVVDDVQIAERAVDDVETG